MAYFSSGEPVEVQGRKPGDTGEVFIQGEDGK
jgi:hypothetical protein